MTTPRSGIRYASVMGAGSGKAHLRRRAGMAKSLAASGGTWPPRPPGMPSTTRARCMCYTAAIIPCAASPRTSFWEHTSRTCATRDARDVDATTTRRLFPNKHRRLFLHQTRRLFLNKASSHFPNQRRGAAPRSRSRRHAHAPARTLARSKKRAKYL